MKRPSSEPDVLTRVRSLADAGARVRAVRKRQGLRIDDAAALNGVSADVFSRLENGRGSVRLDKLLPILDGLGLQLVIAPAGAKLVSEGARSGPDSLASDEDRE